MFGKSNKQQMGAGAQPAPIDVSKEAYGFTYKMSYAEAFDAFRNLSEKGNKKVRIAIIAIISILAVAMLVAYFIDSTQVFYLFLTLVAVIVLFYIIYMPHLKARKGAAQVAKLNGTYKVRITRNGELILPKGDPIALKGDKDARVVETDTIFALRPDRATTLCIPKRVMKQDEADDVRKILSAYMRYFDRRK